MAIRYGQNHVQGLDGIMLMPLRQHLMGISLLLEIQLIH